MSATAQDMGNYVRFFLQRGSVNGKPVVSADAMERTETPATSLTAYRARSRAQGRIRDAQLSGEGAALNEISKSIVRL